MEILMTVCSTERKTNSALEKGKLLNTPSGLTK